MVELQMIKIKLADIREALDGPLDAAIAALQAHKAKVEDNGFINPEIDIDVYDEWGSPAVNIELYAERMETEAEATRRINIAKYAQAEADAYARKQYEQLKAKFG